jgi:hypothetical protein
MTEEDSDKTNNGSLETVAARQEPQRLEPNTEAPLGAQAQPGTDDELALSDEDLELVLALGLC